MKTFTIGKSAALLMLTICSFYAQAQLNLVEQYFEEFRQAAGTQQLWKQPLYGPTLIVDRISRAAYANEADSAGLLVKEGSIYTGKLPENVMVANTAVTWAGKTWSVLLWPLPADREERLSLMLHEAFHRIQTAAGFPLNSPTADHLDNMDGRIYFLLELNALKAALQKPANRRRTDLSNALAFRAQRRKLFPQTFEHERILEMNEGLAEYTGVKLGLSKARIRSYLYQRVDSASAAKSLIRSCAYLTGPLYGLLLDEKAPGWNLSIDAAADFAALISKYYQVSSTQAPDKKLYDGTAIRIREQEREKQRLKVIAGYTQLFTRQPVLKIKLIKNSIFFNPNNLVDLGAYGTVYPTAEVRDVWGHLVAADGMLIKDWQMITVAAGNGIIQEGNKLTGMGWSVTLAEGWKLVRKSEELYELEEEGNKY